MAEVGDSFGRLPRPPALEAAVESLDSDEVSTPLPPPPPAAAAAAASQASARAPVLAAPLRPQQRGAGGGGDDDSSSSSDSLPPLSSPLPLRSQYSAADGCSSSSSGGGGGGSELRQELPNQQSAEVERREEERMRQQRQQHQYQGSPRIELSFPPPAAAPPPSPPPAPALLLPSFAPRRIEPPPPSTRMPAGWTAREEPDDDGHYRFADFELEGFREAAAANRAASAAAEAAAAAAATAAASEATALAAASASSTTAPAVPSPSIAWMPPVVHSLDIDDEEPLVEEHLIVNVSPRAPPPDAPRVVFHFDEAPPLQQQPAPLQQHMQPPSSSSSSSSRAFGCCFPSSSFPSSVSKDDLMFDGCRLQRPLRSPRTWQGVPKELVALIAQYCDPQSLARFGAVDKLNRVVCKDDRLWRRILTIPVEYGAGYAPRFDRNILPKVYFGGRWLQAVHARRALMPQYHRDVKRARQDNRGVVAQYLTNLGFGPVTAVCLLLFFILLVWQWTTRDEVTIVSLWPLAAGVMYVTLCLSFICWQRIRYRRRQSRGLPSDDESLVAQDWIKQGISPIEGTFEMLEESGCVLAVHGWGCWALLALAAFCVAFVLRAAGVYECDWGWVFLPLYVGVLLALGVSYWLHYRTKRSYYSRSPELKWIAVTWAGVGLPLVAFWVLLHLKLQYGHALQLDGWIVLLPLFVLDASTLLYCLRRATEWGCNCDSDDIYAWPLIWVCIIGPLTAFKLMLALMYSNDETGEGEELVRPPVQQGRVDPNHPLSGAVEGSLAVYGNSPRAASISVACAFIPLYFSVCVCVFFACGFTRQIREDTQAYLQWKPKPEHPVEGLPQMFEGMHPRPKHAQQERE